MLSIGGMMNSQTTEELEELAGRLLHLRDSL